MEREREREGGEGPIVANCSLSFFFSVREFKGTSLLDGGLRLI